MMNDEHPPTLLELLATLPDPRVERTRAHRLIDIVFIALCAIICGADSYVRIEEFGQAHEEWLRNFLELPNGIPSHDTFGRVFGRLNPKAFADIFLQWVRGVAQVFAGEVVSIDGKRLREASRRRGKNDVVHVVSAWAAANRLVLGQLKTEEKSNEITAIPELLKTLLVRGCIVTIDAEGCQKDIAKQIVDQEADYVLALKGNHDHLHHEVSTVFARGEEKNFAGTEHSYHETLDKDHGRVEVRRYYTLAVPAWMAKEQQQVWAGLASIGMVYSERHLLGQGVVEKERRYYLSSLESDARVFAGAVRGHWGIENKVHWMLDVGFQEDTCRIRKDHGPENFSLLRRMALNVLNQDRSGKKRSLQTKRCRAGWDKNFLAMLLAPILGTPVAAAT